MKNVEIKTDQENFSSFFACVRVEEEEAGKEAIGRRKRVSLKTCSRFIQSKNNIFLLSATAARSAEYRANGKNEQRQMKKW